TVQLDTYFARTQVPYIPFYAYEEILATFGDPTPPPSGTMLEAMETLVAALTNPEFKATAVRESIRLRVLAEFEGGGDPGLINTAEEMFEQLTPEEAKAAMRILTRLVRVEDPDDKTVPFQISRLDPVDREVVHKLRAAGVVAVQR